MPSYLSPELTTVIYQCQNPWHHWLKPRSQLPADNSGDILLSLLCWFRLLFSADLEVAPTYFVTHSWVSQVSYSFYFGVYVWRGIYVCVFLWEFTCVIVCAHSCFCVPLWMRMHSWTHVWQPEVHVSVFFFQVLSMLFLRQCFSKNMKLISCNYVVIMCTRYPYPAFLGFIGSWDLTSGSNFCSRTTVPNGLSP